MIHLWKSDRSIHRNRISRSSPKRKRHQTWRRSATLLLAVSFGILAAYYLNSLTPEGLENPWKYRCFVGCKRMVTDAAYLLSLLTSAPFIKIFRQMMDLFVQPTPFEVDGSNIRATVTHFNGVKVRLYQPINRTPGSLGPALVYTHGGAFCIGSASSFDIVTRRIAEELDCVVVSIDYRLAPEHPYPAAYHDTLNASKWFIDHAHEFSVDRSRIGIAGDSAGGTLAAAVSHTLHDDPNYPDFAFHALIYPFMQLLDAHTPAAVLSEHIFGKDGSIVTWREAAMFCSFYLLGRSDHRFEQALIQNKHISLEFRQSNAPQLQYVNHSLLPVLDLRFDFKSKTPTKEDDLEDIDTWNEFKDMFLDPRIFPLMRAGLSGLPPAFVATCEFDAVRDHGIFYAVRLRDAGTPVRWVHYDGGFHGVFGPSWPFVFNVGEKMLQDFIVFAKEHLQIDI